MIAVMQMNDVNTFTQKDLMHHLLQAAQHAVTREELQTAKAEIIADMDRRFEQVGIRFGQVDKRFDELKADIKVQGNELKADIKEQGRRHDRLSWAIFAGMLAIFFKDHLTKLLT